MNLPDDLKFSEHRSVNSVQFNLTFQFVNPKIHVMGIAERKNRQKQALRERILDASRRIVMREGFAALSMRKIADAIEYSPATLYLHFASRDEIAQALCEEGYAQLLATFEPHARIADPAERLKALGRAYIAFGVEHPQTYRLIFMEDPSYTGAALGGAARKAQASADEEAGAEVEDATTSSASADSAAHTDDDPGAAALHIMLGALEELKAAGRLSASADVGVWGRGLLGDLAWHCRAEPHVPGVPNGSARHGAEPDARRLVWPIQCRRRARCEGRPQTRRQTHPRAARQTESRERVITFSSISFCAVARSTPCPFPPRPPSATKSRLT
ncbi:AcrR family transcriptional regulator [Paraburkholderia bryophila]|uniref:AcrR family transcriptional regulator n=1 Tax=Paraburkholderia bryophila TaxID=420952 RepID=A0A7Z0B4C9_9BURK|nr:AcrR family transcriptional regulator [Paraburkholderia bryophila]